jgi:serine/threonine protein kinase
MRVPINRGRGTIVADNHPPGPPNGADQDVPQVGTDDVAAWTLTPRYLIDGRYRVERVIGQGAFGRVYRAFDSRLQRTVAIKELLADKRTPDVYVQYLERFEREARAASAAPHPNVVAVHELAIDATGNRYLVMEYIDGSNLRTLLAQVGTLPVERAVRIATDVARALESVHERDIVHRDIKPANIMITRRGAAKLTDFGVAQVRGESLRSQVASGHPGTPLYMSPEQASGTGYLDGRSDLYSLGLVLYEMLTGEPYARRKQSLSALRPDVPQGVIETFERLAANDASDRYATASEAIEALEAVGALSGALGEVSTLPEPDAAPDIPVGSPATHAPDSGRIRSGGRRAVMIGAGAGVLVLVLAVAGILAFTHMRGPAATATPLADNVYFLADNKNLISYAYPKDWQRGGVRSANLDMVAGYTVTNPVAVVTVAKEEIPPSTTLDAYTEEEYARQTRNNPDAQPLAQNKQPTKIGGQDARSLEWVRPSKGQVWLGPSGKIYEYDIVTKRDNRAWLISFATDELQGDPVRRQFNEMASTFTFCPASGCTRRSTFPTAAPGQTIVFADPVVTGLQLQYPADWYRVPPEELGASKYAVYLVSAEDVEFAASMVGSGGTLAEATDTFVQSLMNNSDYAYRISSVVDATVGGAPAKMITSEYTSKSNPNLTPRNQVDWVVEYGGKHFILTGGNFGSHRSEIDAIIQSIKFSTPAAAVAVIQPQSFPDQR